LGKAKRKPKKSIKFDKDKLRYDLVPVAPLEKIVSVLTFGAGKYDDRNWENGFKWSRVYGATQRHLNKWWGGEDLDKESRVTHLAHAACCILFLMEYEETHRELDDRVKPKRKVKK